MAKYPARQMTAAGHRAAAKVGRPCGIGWCMREVKDLYGIPPPWGWAGNGRPWAINFWLNAVKRGRVVKTSNAMAPPFGAMIFFDSSRNRPEHVAISAGGGYCYTTDYPRRGRWGRVRISSLGSAWGMRLVGYILVTGDGYTLTDKKASVDPKDPKAYYLGAEGAHVTTLGKNLVAKGFGSHYKSGPGPTFGEADRLNVKDCQTALGFTGTDADGFPGVTTLTYLTSPSKSIDTPTEPPAPPGDGQL